MDYLSTVTPIRSVTLTSCLEEMKAWMKLNFIQPYSSTPDLQLHHQYHFLQDQDNPLSPTMTTLV